MRSDTDRYFSDELVFVEARTNDGKDAIESYSLAPPWQDIPFPAPSRLPDLLDGEREGQRILRIEALGNDNGRRAAHLQAPSFQAALLETNKALWLVVGGYVGEGEDRAPAKDVNSSIGVIDAGRHGQFKRLWGDFPVARCAPRVGNLSRHTPHPRARERRLNRQR